MGTKFGYKTYQECAIADLEAIPTMTDRQLLELIAEKIIFNELLFRKDAIKE